MLVKPRKRRSMEVRQKSFWLDDAHRHPLPSDRPVVVDGFAGGGGASWGIQMAIGRGPDVAINHDRDAIAMHMANHPDTKHYCENIFDVDPEEACEGRQIGFAWFSPDCTHFSRARGKKPVKKEIRGLAQAIIPWAEMPEQLRPRVIFVENVAEFKTWGPIDDETGQPIKERAGEYFDEWVAKLRSLGYEVDWRELVASDYGAPTTRKRLFIVARCDGRPIVWPAATHASPARIAKEKLQLQPWRTAAEIIDWSIPCPSIFLSKAEAKRAGCIRPLAEKTLARIAEGIKRYVIESPSPYIVRVNHGSEHWRGQPLDQPLGTACRTNGFALVSPTIVSYYGPKDGGEAANHRGRSLEEPIATVTTENRFGVVTPYLVALQHGGMTGSIEYPLRTVCASPKDCHCVVEPVIAPFVSSTANQGTTGRAPYVWPVEDPLRTLTTTGDKVMVAPVLSRMFGASVGSSVDSPVGSLTSENKTAVVAAFVAKHFGGMVGVSAEQPFPTITAVGTQNQLVAATLIKNNHGDKQAFDIDEPLRTVMAGANHHGVVQAILESAKGDGAALPTPFTRFAHTRAFLFKYFGTGGYVGCEEPISSLTTKDRLALGIVLIGGEPYQIIDIGMRMLTPRELFLAQGFPSTYQIEAGEDGRSLSKSAQVARCGNSVPPPFAAALVRANLPEMCR